ncbi:MAG: MAE_28990/MAE_18760 family HEPN-like nuclease [Victivallaceae bacterium]|jgi:hypothetical protein
MATFLHEFVNDIEQKWKEIDILIEAAANANKNKNKNNDLYNALCRSITVLCVAHFEGFIKDCLKSLINDLNRNMRFCDLPSSIKRTYCKKYLGSNLKSEDKQYDKRMDLLIRKFDEIDAKISYEPFYSPTNKNPNSHILKTVLINIGINDIYSCLHESDFEIIFSSESKEIYEILKKLKQKTLSGIGNFPYTFADDLYNLKEKKNKNIRTLWEEFIYVFNDKRHDVAHGNNFNNSLDIKDLETNKLKIMIIELCFIIVICSFITKKSGSRK